ncbi:MAG: electron transport complex subunit RsxC [Planctomycetes bacterium]|nr:electron transport complex subunit RsxC [Planctomycetota bacterium]
MRSSPHSKTFAHGVHPPECKDDTSALPIRQFPFAPVQVVPLLQHLGKPAIAEVAEGQEVVRGQRIARPDGFMSVAMHAPVSGVVQRIGLAPAISGRMEPAIFVRPFPGSTQEPAQGRPVDARTATPEQIIAAVQEAGIVGLGGASFPTHVKLKLPDGKRGDTLLINGAECEPYLTADHRVMLEHAADVMAGIPFLLKATGTERAIVCIESNKQDAAAVMRAAIPPGQPVSVEVLPVKYPQGAEKMLITAILGREVPSGGLPIDVGTLCVNVATCAEIGQLLPRGAGIHERVLTVGGPGIRKKGNYRVPIGTPLRFLLESVGYEPDLTRVFLGGPMMGQAVSSLDIPVTKGTTGVIGFTARETGNVAEQREHPCIRCGYCLEACPIFLNPSMLGLLARNEQHQRMADDFHLMDCFECGSCTFVCPAHIPLVQHFRISKRAVRRAKAAGK